MNTIELGEKGKSDPMVKVGLSIILISALVWPVIPTALGIDGWGKGQRRGGSANWAGYCGHFGVVGLAGV